LGWEPFSYRLPMKVNIIGGGIAGLTAGCHLQLNGFDSEIFEAHAVPGGLCTSWKIGDYTVDGCLHWLVGSNPVDPVYKLWNELIDMKSIRFYDYEEFFRVRGKDGKEIVGYTNLDRLYAELTSKAPEDIKLIDEFISSVRKLSRMKMRMDKAPELYSAWDKFIENLHFMPYLKPLIRYGKMTIREFSEGCKNPLLAKFFEYSFLSEMPVLFIMFTFSWLDRKTAGYPIGGSLYFARMIEQKYLDLGGKIHYHSMVKNINTEPAGKLQRACGIELEDGQFYPSDITISAADGHSTIFDMLEGRFVDDRIRHYYTDFSVFPAFLQISLGVAKEFRDRPHTVAMPLEKPYVIDPEKTIENLYYRIVHYDPTLAPEGKTLIIGMVKTYNYQYWQDLREKDREKYKTEKKRIADFYIDILDKELGGIRENLEMVDVATPATTIRFTHNWKGSVEGWMVTRETGFDSLPKELPGLKDFYMAGQWVEPGGGVPSSFFSGRNVVQVICRKYK
jgi:phytoene dehydrogenase-like protein